MTQPSFSSLKKQIYKNKNYLPTMSAKESALIPLVKNLNRSKNIITTITEYTIDLQRNIKETTQYCYQTLEVGKHHTMDPIMEGIISCSLAYSRGIFLLSFNSRYNNSLHVPLHCLNPFIQCYHHLRKFQRRNILEVEPSKKSSYIYYI